MKRRTFFVFLLASILMFLSLSPAIAQEPEIERVEFSNNFDIDCGDFTAIFEEEWRLSITTFFDMNGIATHIMVHGNIFGTVTNSETNSVLEDFASFNNTIDLTQGGAMFERGIFWHLFLPGKGLAVINAGKIIFGEGGVFVSANGILQPDTIDFICDGLRGV